jgi:hypothetical protein
LTNVKNDGPSEDDHGSLFIPEVTKPDLTSIHIGPQTSIVVHSGSSTSGCSR